MPRLAQGSTRESAQFVGFRGGTLGPRSAGVRPHGAQPAWSGSLGRPSPVQTSRSSTPFRRLPRVVSTRRTRTVGRIRPEVPLPPIGSARGGCYHRLGWSNIKQRGLGALPAGRHQPSGFSGISGACPPSLQCSVPAGTVVIIRPLPVSGAGGGGLAKNNDGLPAQRPSQGGGSRDDAARDCSCASRFLATPGTTTSSRAKESFRCSF
jgi:hypothetical protein